MSSMMDNVHLALPEMIILTTVVVAIVFDLFLSKKVKNIAFVVACIGLVLATISSMVFIGNFKTLVFNGLYVADDTAQLMKCFICAIVLLCFFYSRQYVNTRAIPAGEYYILGLLSTLGMMVLVSSHSLLTVYLGLELMSLPLYAMTAMNRDDSNAAEAAMKYFVMGAIASGMLLYGMSMLYGITGKLNLFEVANAVASSWQDNHSMLAFALVFIVAGVGFKLAAVPFHMWAPDVYEGAPAAVTLFISAAPKIAAMGMVFRLLTLGLIDVSAMWQQLILVMALLSTGIGNLLAIAQTNIKRMLAYSAISHSGYALFGILVAAPQGYAASLFYILVYSLMSAAAFGLVVLISGQGSDIQNIDDLKGLNKRNPWLAFMMLIVMFSMAGVPPTVGFFSKLLVIKALIDAQMIWVAVMGLMFAVIGAFYYLRVVKVMYFDAPDASMEDVSIDRFGQLVFSVNAMALLYLGIFPTGLIDACMNAFNS